MKSHYKLVNGRPERVGLIKGKKVMLVAVEPIKHVDGRYCPQCAFRPYSCPSKLDSQDVLGADCTDASNLVYKGVK